MTEHRKRWLEWLAAYGVSSRAGWHRVPYDCMKLGWTCWVWNDDKTKPLGEMLTDAGRREIGLPPQDPANG